MKNFFLSLCMIVISKASWAGMSPTQVIEGIITKIEKDNVTVVSQGKDIVVDKKFIPKDKLRAGKRISIVIETKENK